VYSFLSALTRSWLISTQYKKSRNLITFYRRTLIFKTAELLRKSPLLKRSFKNYTSVSPHSHKVCTEFDTHILFGILGHSKYKSYAGIKGTKQVGGERTSPLEEWHHPTPSPDLTPRDFHLFFNLKKHLSGQKFHEGKEVKNKVTTWLCVQAVEFYDIRTQILIPRLNKCLDKCSDYVKKK
jgi:hypothetical protein